MQLIKDVSGLTALSRKPLQLALEPLQLYYLKVQNIKLLTLDDKASETTNKAGGKAQRYKYKREIQ